MPEFQPKDSLSDDGAAVEDPSMFNDGPTISTKTIASKANSAVARKDALKPLESTLDFILRCLEGEHAKSNKITESVRSSVLAHVRDAIDWKRQIRSQEEVEEKVAELNAMMGGIVSQI